MQHISPRTPGTGTRPGNRHDSRAPGRAPRRPAAADPRTSAGGRSRLPRYWFAERLLSVLSGHRPVHWMLGHTIGRAYEQLVRLAPGTPLSNNGLRPVLRHCDEYAPRPGVIEAFARITAGDQVRAMAFRLEQGPDLRWRCAAVELGGERLTAGV
ncbi:Rv3235 family protein [Streptomyces sp. HNM0645]|uniref:Rv3235 family protein n=1 Tax=Streptomyces sp. HNM0645 TaxID=2782343 RepID=UPI0024B86534|nr:Rv3235 family protein [Streptomyces sp. HNM0645]MDI9888970.1 Rv3235 family protein [Streptomyces sp. HNM0645]